VAEGLPQVSRWSPQLAVSEAGDPLFLLTVLLGAAPEGPAASWLVMDGSVLEARFTLALRAGADSSTRRVPTIDQVTFDIVHERQTLPGARADGTGSPLTASMRVPLDAREARAVLDAIDDPQSAMQVTADLSYAADPVMQRVRLSGWWSAIYDALQPAFAGQSTISHAALHDQFAAMVHNGTIAVMGRNADVDALFRGFVGASGIILRRATPKMKVHDAGNRYGLLRRPERASLNVTVDSPLTQRETVTVSAPLGALVGRSLAGQDRSRFVRLVNLAATPAAVSDI
jgi:hypothetical protein